MASLFEWLDEEESIVRGELDALRASQPLQHVRPLSRHGQAHLRRCAAAGQRCGPVPAPGGRTI
jgi:hypothetical protein